MRGVFQEFGNPRFATGGFCFHRWHDGERARKSRSIPGAAPCAALGRNALDEFIDHHARENDCADDGKFQMRRDVQDVDRVVKHAHDGGHNDDPENLSSPAAQAAPAEHRRGNGVQFVEFTKAVRLDGIQVEGKKNTGESRKR